MLGESQVRKIDRSLSSISSRETFSSQSISGDSCSAGGKLSARPTASGPEEKAESGKGSGRGRGGGEKGSLSRIEGCTDPPVMSSQTWLHPRSSGNL